MPKDIKSHRNLSVNWNKQRNSFLLDLRPIGGDRVSFPSKAEATQHAKDMFEVFETGKPATEIKPWTVEKAIKQYLAHATRRSEDPDDEDDPSSLTNQRCHLKNCAGLSFDGLALAKRNVADLDAADVEEFLKDRFWKPSPPTKKIMGFWIPRLRSWNWAGFFFNVYWLIYRKQKLGWFFLVFSLLCLLPEHWDPGLDTLSAIPLVVAVVCGGKGDSFIMVNALKMYAKKTPLDDRNPRSIIGPIIAIILTIVYFVIYGVLLNKGIIPPLEASSLASQ